MTNIDLVIRLHQIPDGTWTRCCSLNSRKPFQEGCVIAPAWRVYTYQNPFSPVRIQSTKVLLKRPDVQRYPDDTRRAPAKPPAQPVGMAESDMNKSSWQKPACTHSAHRRRCVLELGPQIPQQRGVCGQAVPRFTRLAKKKPPPGRAPTMRPASTVRLFSRTFHLGSFR